MLPLTTKWRKRARKRKANWAQKEFSLLTDMVLEKNDVLFPKFSSKMTKKKKELAWEEISNKISSLGVLLPGIHKSSKMPGRAFLTIGIHLIHPNRPTGSAQTDDKWSSCFG